jgi:hypothetical protein
MGDMVITPKGRHLENSGMRSSQARDPIAVVAWIQDDILRLPAIMQRLIENQVKVMDEIQVRLHA